MPKDMLNGRIARGSVSRVSETVANVCLSAALGTLAGLFKSAPLICDNCSAEFDVFWRGEALPPSVCSLCTGDLIDLSFVWQASSAPDEDDPSPVQVHLIGAPRNGLG